MKYRLRSEGNAMGLREKVRRFFQEKRSLDHQLETLLSELLDKVSDLETRLARVEASVRALSERDASRRSDISDHTFLKHEDVATKFANFIDQEVCAVAERITQTSVGIDGAATIDDLVAVSTRKEAKVVSSITRLLFGDDHALREANRDDLLERLREEGVVLEASDLEDLAAQARAVCAMASATGHEYQWGFVCTPDALVDEKEQEPWGICSPRSPVEFVVTPAYVVIRSGNPRTYAKQRVFTAVVTPS